MSENTQATENLSDIQSEVPCEAMSNPALLFLYYRVERALGIKAGSEALVILNEYIEKSCGDSFIKNPAVFERFLSSRERIYDISKFLTVNETYFFREEVHFEILSSLLPELAKLNRSIRICCAAVSIGCEAYSIAMLFDYNIKKGLDIDFSIDAFDINSSVIETAKNARYTANAFRTDGSSWKYILDSYLVPDKGEYVVSKNIREKVNFFTHNIMRGLDKQYDIIFFRNSLIYFSSKSRLSVISNISDALLNNGYLFLGASETSSANHPLLLNRFSCDAFYFQKTNITKLKEQTDIKPKESEREAQSSREEIKPKPLPVKRDEIYINCAEITEILKTDEGKINAQNVIACLSDGTGSSLSGSGLAAYALYCLNAQDFDPAGKVISFLEKNNSSEFILFIKGELLFLQGFFEDAEKYYQKAAIKNRFFWPAFYRIAILAAEGNRTRYEYKIKKAIESIELAQNQNHDKERNYECFLGGFSSDYFVRILEKKFVSERGVT